MARNMIVRLGVDASSFLQKMVKAGVTAESTGQKIKKSLTADQRSSMTAQLEKMKATYQAIRNATEMEDIDLSRSLTKQIDDAEKAYHGFLEEAQKTKEALRAALNSSGAKGSAQNVAALRNDLNALRTSANEAGSELERLKRIAGEIGSENINFASHTGIKKLESEINQMEMALDETGDEARQTESFISRMARAFRSADGSGRRLSIIPGFIRRIGDSASRSDMSLSRMVRTIRNVSVVSFGLRIVNGLFGELGTIVRNYISQDAQLQAQVNGLSASMGNALAPAIHLVTGALSYVLPYVVGVSNAIGQLMAALTGKGWSAASTGAGKVASATGGAAKAQKELNRQLLSFDQINRMESQKGSGGGGGGGGAGSALEEIVGKTPAWMERFKSSFTDLFNSSEFQEANIGGKLGMALQTGLDWLGAEGMNFDWRGVGTKLRENFDSFIETGWGESFFYTLGVYLGGFSDLMMGFLGPQLDELRVAYKNEGWQGAVVYAMGLKIGLVGNLISGLFTNALAPVFTGIADFFREHGEFSIAGFFDGCAQAMTNVGTWIKDNITDPIVNWIKNLLGIHSPSTVFASIGQSCMDGLGSGFSDGVAGVLQRLSDLRDRVVDIAGNLKEAFSFEWSLPNLRLPHLHVDWDPVDNVLANFFGVTAFPRLSVRWFAKGGILNGAQIFGSLGSTLLGGGERGREAILPLDANTGWMDVLANRIAQSLNVDNSNGDTVVNVHLDGDLITSYVLKKIRNKSRAGTVSI